MDFLIDTIVLAKSDFGETFSEFLISSNCHKSGTIRLSLRQKGYILFTQISLDFSKVALTPPPSQRHNPLITIICHSWRIKYSTLNLIAVAKLSTNLTKHLAKSRLEFDSFYPHTFASLEPRKYLPFCSSIGSLHLATLSWPR